MIMRLRFKLLMPIFSLVPVQLLCRLDFFEMEVYWYFSGILY